MTFRSIAAKDSVRPKKSVYGLFVNTCRQHDGAWLDADTVKPAKSVAVATPGPVRCVMASLLAAPLAASCQPLEQGYWMKPSLPQTSQDAEYRRDSEECASQGVEQVLMNQTPRGDTIVARLPSASGLSSNLYGRCMMSRGYEWVKLQPLVPPPPHQETANEGPCPAERVVTDPFGFPHCASMNPDQHAATDHVPHESQAAAPESPATSLSTDKDPAAESFPSGDVPRQPRSTTQLEGGHDYRTNSGPPPADRRAFDNSLCIQQSQNSLSSPYGTYLHCMEEKGWPALPR